MENLEEILFEDFGFLYLQIEIGNNNRYRLYFGKIGFLVKTEINVVYFWRGAKLEPPQNQKKGAVW